MKSLLLVALAGVLTGLGSSFYPTSILILISLFVWIRELNSNYKNNLTKTLVFIITLHLTTFIWMPLQVMALNPLNNIFVSIGFFLFIFTIHHLHYLLFSIVYALSFKLKKVEQIVFLTGSWVFLEWASNQLVWGRLFEVSLGYSLANVPYVNQIASLGGVYLLSLIVILVNLVIKEKVTYKLVTCLFIASLMGMTYLQKESLIKINNLTIVQINNKETKQKQEPVDYLRATYLRATYLEEQVKQAQGIIEIIRKEKEGGVYLFPEVSWPFNLQESLLIRSQSLNDQLIKEVNNKKSTLYIGSLYSIDDMAENTIVKIKNGNISYFKKNIPMPFMEKIPELPQWMIESPIGSLLSGRTVDSKSQKINYDHYEGLSFGMLMCSEVMEQGLSLKIKKETNFDFIVVFSDESMIEGVSQNTTWNYSIIRSIETGSPIIRVANTGTSGIIYPNGTYLKYEKNKYLKETLSFESYKVDTFFVKYPLALIFISLMVSLLFLFKITFKNN